MFLLLRYRDFHVLLILLGVLPLAAILLFNLLADIAGYSEYMMTFEDFFDILYNITQSITNPSKRK